MANYLPLLETTLFCGENLGSIREAEIIRFEDVVSLPVFDSSGGSSGNIETVTGANFVKINFEPDTVFLRSTGKTEAAGLAIEVILEGRIPRNRPEVSARILRFANGWFIIRATDYNGEIYLLGTKDRPMRFRFRSNSNNSRNRPGVTFFTFFGFASRPTPEFSGTITAGPSSPGDYSSADYNSDYFTD